MIYLRRIFEMPRPFKVAVAAAFDGLAVALAWWLSMSIRLDTFTNHFVELAPAVVAFTAAACIAAMYVAGLYRSIIRYIGLRIVTTLSIGVVAATVALIASSFYLQQLLPRTIPFIFGPLLLILLAAPRLTLRWLVGEPFSVAEREPILIYGAGSSGRQLLQAILHGDEYRPVGFIDDDTTLQGTLIQGIPVYASEKIPLLVERRSVTKILLAMARTKRSKVNRVVESLEALPVAVLSIPRMADVVAGRARIDQVSDISIDDLLGRDAVEPDVVLMRMNTMDKNVLVTGGGGSIGSELARQILRQGPARLVLLELSEFALYQVERDLRALKEQLGVDTEIVPLLGSVQSRHRLDTVFGTYAIDTVYHAAAYKHVPMVEFNVAEGVLNNVFGTACCAQAAVAHGVDTFVLISTDKAVRPTNVMGASKRLAELVLQALAQQKSGTRFCMVRFGNVLGSSGSVVPLFREQIRKGGPVTVTHREITRFFMTISEAAQLVVQAGAMGRGGDVFVLDMGRPVRIHDLAARMIRLAGHRAKDDEHPDGDIEIQITGLRPGEKLYEELLIGDNTRTTSHPRIMSADEAMLPWSTLQNILDDLKRRCAAGDQDGIRRCLVAAPLGFRPADDIADLVWVQSKGKLRAVPGGPETSPGAKRDAG